MTLAAALLAGLVSRRRLVDVVIGTFVGGVVVFVSMGASARLAGVFNLGIV